MKLCPPQIGGEKMGGVILSLDVDTIYYLLHQLPPNKITIYCAWNGSYHDSWDDYYISVPEDLVDYVKEKIVELHSEGKISDNNFNYYMEQFDAEYWQNTFKQFLKHGEIVNEEQFIQQYNKQRDREITAIDRSLRNFHR